MVRKAVCLLAALVAPLACDGFLKDLSGTRCDGDGRCGAAGSGYVCCADGHCRRAGQCVESGSDAAPPPVGPDAAQPDSAVAVDAGVLLPDASVDSGTLQLPDASVDSGTLQPPDASAADAMVAVDAGSADAAVRADAGAACLSPRTWLHIGEPSTATATGPYIHAGTDGKRLFVVHWDNTFWRHEPSDGGGGTWTQLTRPSTSFPVCADSSISDLAYQNGYLYTSAHPTGPERAVVRYSVSNASWEVLGTDAGFTKSMTTGNAMIMDPNQPGVGLSVWAAGDWWVQFDWDNRTADDRWMSLGDGLPGSFRDPKTVSVSDDVAADGSGRYFATKIDWGSGNSSGDLVYTWTGLAKRTKVSFFVATPWQAGRGQALEFIPASLSPCRRNELWLLRGEDGDAEPHKGEGNPTADWARLFVDSPDAGWTSEPQLPAKVTADGELVLVPPHVYVHTKNGWYTTTLP